MSLSSAPLMACLFVFAFSLIGCVERDAGDAAPIETLSQSPESSPETFLSDEQLTERERQLVRGRGHPEWRLFRGGNGALRVLWIHQALNDATRPLADELARLNLQIAESRREYALQRVLQDDPESGVEWFDDEDELASYAEVVSLVNWDHEYVRVTRGRAAVDMRAWMATTGDELRTRRQDLEGELRAKHGVTVSSIELRPPVPTSSPTSHPR